MTATAEQAHFAFAEWHRRIGERDAAGLVAMYRDDATIESPLVTRVFDENTRGIVQGREQIDRFISKITASRPSDDELDSLYRTGEYMFDGTTLIWEYPRETPDRSPPHLLGLAGRRARDRQRRRQSVPIADRSSVTNGQPVASFDAESGSC